MTHACITHPYTYIPAPQIPGADPGPGEVRLVEDGEH